MMDNEQQTLTVSIDGRSYRMACAAGEEPHLMNLASILDQRVGMLRDSVGEIGDMRLHVMAALTIADELLEAQKKIKKLEDDSYLLRQKQQLETETDMVFEKKMTSAVLNLAERLEKLTIDLKSQKRE